MNQTRRTFFKTIAAAGTTAVVVPAVVRGGGENNSNAKWTVTVNGKVVELSQDQYEEIYWNAIHDIIKMMEKPDFLDHD